MTLDAYTLWIFVAGVLLGVALAILATVVHQLPKAIDDYRRAFRSRRRPPAEPRPLERR